MKFDVEVDATGLYCPLPILRLAKAFRDRAPGTVALLTATDPASVEDVDAFCREKRYELVHRDMKDDVFSFCIRKRS